MLGFATNRDSLLLATLWYILITVAALSAYQICGPYVFVVSNMLLSQKTIVYPDYWASTYL